MKALVWWSFGCALIPALLFFKNLRLYVKPPLRSENSRPQVSVLIPARDEERNIGAAIEAVLENRDVDLEVIVLDDHSSDRTADLVSEIAVRDPQVRLECAPELPPGWCGKQHACWILAQHARYPLLVFVDADVRIAPDALARIAAFVERSGADLVSGVPRQITQTWLEKLLIPLVHFVLLGFLPLDRMRKDPSPAFGAGCGQLFAARREAYFRTGGHREIRESMHDGITLPRSFRRAGFRTDLFDPTSLASCRMYNSGPEVWSGLSKNAAEGLANRRVIVPMSVLLFSGQILPWILVLMRPGLWIAWAAALVSLIPRFAAVARFKQPFESAVLHPIGILLLLVIQWQAFCRKFAGLQPTWKGRTVEQAESSYQKCNLC
ncbi:glycosyltransferase [Verrucomicrobiota bacterium sgz303538]